MATEQPKKPLVQIDDEIREMTDDEHQEWLTNVAGKPGAPEAPDVVA